MLGEFNTGQATLDAIDEISFEEGRGKSLNILFTYLFTSGL